MLDNLFWDSRCCNPTSVPTAFCECTDPNVEQFPIRWVFVQETSPRTPVWSRMPQHRHLEAGPFICFLLKVAKCESLSACFLRIVFFGFGLFPQTPVWLAREVFLYFSFLPEGTLNTPLLLLLQPRTDSKEASFKGCAPSGCEVFFSNQSQHLSHNSTWRRTSRVFLCSYVCRSSTLSHPDCRGMVSLSCSKPRFLIRRVSLRLLHKEGSAFRSKRTADNWLPFSWEDVASTMKTPQGPFHQHRGLVISL